MSNIPIKNANGDTVFRKATGAGTDGDPAVSHFILDNNGQPISTTNPLPINTITDTTRIVTDNNGSVSPIEISEDFYLAVSMGQIPGFSTVDKYGENPDIDTGSGKVDIWEGESLYSYDTDGTAPIISLGSTIGGDTQPINVQGLDINGDFVSQTINLTGTTRVALTTPLWRVYRMSNEGSTDITGMVFCYTGTGGVPSVGDAEVRAIINNGNNQTLMALYTIPKGKVGFLCRGEIACSRSQSTGEVQSAYYSRRLGKVFKVKKRINITNQGSSIYQDYRSFPDIIPSLTDIRLAVESVSANNVGVTGTFDVLLVDETLFPVTYLQAIGQPGY